MTGVSSPTRTLAELVASYRWDDVAPDVRERVLFAVRDALACAVGGSRTDLARLHRTAVGVSGIPEASLIATGQRAPAPTAAYHNATAVNAMDYDDTAPHSGHPGAVVVSAALAMAEREKTSGATFLTAVVAGYEVALRVAAACRPSPARYDVVHGSSSFLGLGAAVAAGRVLGLDAAALARAIGAAGPISPVPAAGKFGFDEAQLSWIKDNVNWPAEAGVRSALLVAAGFPASSSLLDGDRGFWRMAGSDRFDPDRLADPRAFHLRDLAFKPYPCCRWLHAALDALSEIIEHRSLSHPLDIARVRIASTGAVAASFLNRRPVTMVDAQYSAPHAVAALVLGIPYVDWWRAEHRTSATVKALMDRVELVEDPELTAAFLRDGRNVNRLPARVTVRLADGREVTGFCDHPMGTPGRVDAVSASREGAHFTAKHRALFGLLLDDAGIDAVSAGIAALPAAPSVGQVTGPLTRPLTPHA